MKEVTPLNQAMSLKASDMLRVLQKSCRRACQLFCCSLHSLWCEKLPCFQAQNHHPTQDQTKQVVLRSPPSTILIVNISNSTLIDCVIGNDTYPSALAESQPLMQESELHMHNEMRCSCSHEHQGATGSSLSPPPPLPPEEPSSINIHGSQLNCVIIGDNNYMHAEQIQPIEPEKPPV